jgi:hypothetical protein
MDFPSIKMNTDYFREYDVVLTPFNLESLLLYHRLKNDHINVVAFFDNDPHLWGKYYLDVPVISAYYRTNTKVIVASETFYQEIKKQLILFTFSETDIYMADRIGTRTVVSDIIFDVNADLYAQFRPSQALGQFSDGYAKIKKLRRIAQIGCSENDFLYMRRVELIVTHKCTLKCKYCGSMPSFFEKPYNMDIETLKRDYDLMIGRVDFLNDVLIMGGEPLLHPKLSEYIAYVCEHPLTAERVGIVRLITNGTITPKPEIFNLLKKYGVQLLVSNYRELSPKLNEIILRCMENEVRYQVLYIPHWWLVENPTNGEIVTDEEWKDKCRSCVHQHRVIAEGKFYRCSFLSSGDSLGIFPSDERNYVDMLGSDFCKQNIADYINLEKYYVPGCRFCVGQSLEQQEKDLIPAAMQYDTVPVRYKRYE